MTYIVYLKYIFLSQAKTVNEVYFRQYFIETTVMTIFFKRISGLAKKLASITSPLTFFNVSGTANPLMQMLASLISGIAD